MTISTRHHSLKATELLMIFVKLPNPIWYKALQYLSSLNMIVLCGAKIIHETLVLLETFRSRPLCLPDRSLQFYIKSEPDHVVYKILPLFYPFRMQTDRSNTHTHFQEHLFLHESYPHPKFLSGRILLIMSAICDDMIIFEVQSLSY